MSSGRRRSPVHREDNVVLYCCHSKEGLGLDLTAPNQASRVLCTVLLLQRKIARFRAVLIAMLERDYEKM